MKLMNINLYITDDNSQSHIINFFNQSKMIDFNFSKLSNINKNIKERNLIIIKESELFVSFIKKNQPVFNNKKFRNLCFFSPTSLDKINVFFSFKYIRYPIKFPLFEKKLINIFSIKNNSYKYLELKFDNTLFNTNNSKQVHLTEIESKITKMLFQKQVIDKKNINRNILLQADITDSKSIDSHLYRIRKKLRQIDSKIQIISTDNQKVKIS